MYDIIIIGAGPAGLTAAIYALREEKNILLIEKGVFGGQMTFSPKIENYPGFAALSGNELADKMLEQVVKLGGEFETGKAVEIRVNGATKEAITENGAFCSKALIIATGASHKHLNVEGEKELIGKGISFCAVCDGDFYADNKVIVVGGGNSALQEALMLCAGCKKVTVVQDLPYLTGGKRLAETLKKHNNVEFAFNSVVTGFVSNGSLKGVKIKNTATGEEKTLDCEGCFVAIGLNPETKFARNIIKTDSLGYFEAGENCQTNVEGIFAAGDCRKKEIRQIITACADGAAAALGARAYIDER